MTNKLNIWNIVDIIGLITTFIFILQVFINILNQFQQPIRVILGIYIISLIIQNIGKFNIFLMAVSFYLSIGLIIKEIFEMLKITDSVLGILILIILYLIYKEGRIQQETISRIGMILGFGK